MIQRSTLFLMIAALCASCSAPQKDADAVAGRLLDDSATEAERVALAKDHVDGAAAVLTAMIRGMEPGTEEEYRRIPWLWRVSRVAGESNDPRVILEVLAAASPQEGEPLHDWQAVVLGGGIVSGLSAAGEWPSERIEQITADRPDLAAHYERAVELSAAMADDPSVPDPTRYDALRLVAMAGWDAASPQLIRYLGADVHAELQMGAVGGLGDIRAPDVDSVLIHYFGEYAPYNRRLALASLTRSDARARALMDALERGTIHPDSLDQEHRERLLERPALRERASTLLMDR